MQILSDCISGSFPKKCAMLIALQNRGYFCPDFQASAGFNVHKMIIFVRFKGHFIKRLNAQHFLLYRSFNKLQEISVNCAHLEDFIYSAQSDNRVKPKVIHKEDK